MAKNYFRRGRARVAAVVGQKGGVGKSIAAQTLAMIISALGHYDQILLFDMDPNPGQTQAWDIFSDNWAEDHRQEPPQYLAQAEASPDTLTVNRVIMHPEQGLGQGLMWAIPMTDIIQGLAQMRRIREVLKTKRVGGILLSDLVEQTVNTYGITMGQQTPLYVIPNTQNLRNIVAAMEAKHAVDRTFEPRAFFAHAMDVLHAKGFINERTLVIVDTAGEAGLLPDGTEWEADLLIELYTPNSLALKGMLNTFKNAVRIRRDRRDADQRPFFSDPILNMATGSTEEAEWVEDEVAAKLQPYSLAPSRFVLNSSPDVGRRPGMKGTPSWAYNPMDPVNLTLLAFAQEYLIPGAQ